VGQSRSKCGVGKTPLLKLRAESNNERPSFLKKRRHGCDGAPEAERGVR